MIYFFTTSAYNYYPSAKALCQSVKKIYPDCHFVFFLVDKKRDYDPLEDGFDTVLSFSDIAHEIPIPIEAWIYRHNVMELATAVKPFVLHKLLQKNDCDSIIFIDPDSYVFNPLDSVLEALDKHSIVLTPHMCQPAQKALDYRELPPLQHGAFNLGFFAIKNTAIGNAFASWWKDRLEKYCLIEKGKGLFTDQKWIDLVPCFFEDHFILRDTSINVAAWNTFQRIISGSVPNNIYVDDKPLGFYHFSGIFTGRHANVTRKLALNPDLLIELQTWYENLIKKDRNNHLFSAPWGYEMYDNEQPIPQEHRQMYRKDIELIHKFTNPFDTSCESNYYDYVMNIQLRQLSKKIAPIS